MSSAKDIASAFTITGLLDESAKTQRRYPVAEVPVNDISDHPGNTAYSMDEDGITRLAASIKEQGITDLPLVRKKDDGTYQMVSGHRRKAAYTLLARDDDTYAKMPCRIIENLTDEESETLLHAANYFTRALTVTERAAATRALGVVVEQRRNVDPSLAGARTEDIKAAIIAEQTGRKVSGKTIKRQEVLAELIETKLIDAWRTKAESGSLSASCIEKIACMSESDQVELYDSLPQEATSKAAITKHIDDALAVKPAEEEKLARKRELALILRESFHPQADARLKVAITSLRNYLSEPPTGTQEPDLKASALLRCLSDHLPKPDVKTPKRDKGRLRHS
ncbi:ParB N-terminal domain-containing protein [Adlercreutzia sp. ZJ138]|uniref:ParB/RepB/Spo0J family partition protein n=1 Tax=Adlercreutzia sp. ZJ138 TaxID=2709405 RepID=UPI0013EC7BDA|nr:ParB N-terminal domain-containing protein [Adlercreutzia sp. ZJ138]